MVTYYRSEGAGWVSAKVTSAQTGYANYFNIEHIDGTLPRKDGTYLLPPSEEDVFCWSLLRAVRPKSKPRQTAQENLRSEDHHITKQLTPEGGGDRNIPDLHITPDQFLLPGAVHYIPELSSPDYFTWHHTPEPQPDTDVTLSPLSSRCKKKHDKVYREKYASLQLIPEQEHLRHSLALNAADDAVYVLRRDSTHTGGWLNPFRRK